MEMSPVYDYDVTVTFFYRFFHISRGQRVNKQFETSSTVDGWYFMDKDTWLTPSASGEHIYRAEAYQR